MYKVRIFEIEEEIDILVEMPTIPRKGEQICCFFAENDFRVCNIVSIRHYIYPDGKFEEIEISVNAC